MKYTYSKSWPTNQNYSVSATITHSGLNKREFIYTSNPRFYRWQIKLDIHVPKIRYKTNITVLKLLANRKFRLFSSFPLVMHYTFFGTDDFWILKVPPFTGWQLNAGLFPFLLSLFADEFKISKSCCIYQKDVEEIHVFRKISTTKHTKKWLWVCPKQNLNASKFLHVSKTTNYTFALLLCQN